MAQALRKQVPRPTAGFGGGPPELRAEVLYPQWWRNPAIVMRGWRPRVIATRQSLGERLVAAGLAAFNQLREWRERAQSRQALLKLDDYMLRDLGIDRATAQFKGSLPFWHADD